MKNLLQIPGSTTPITKGIADNEDGFILVLAMLMLVVLTLLGTAGIQNSTIELQIAGNERMAAVNLYNAEGSAYEAAQKVLNEGDNSKLLPKLNPAPTSTNLIRSARDESVELADIKNLDTNDDGTIDAVSDNFAVASIEAVATAGEKLRNVVVLNNITAGSSLALGASRLYDYTSYGYAESNGKSIVKLGLKKRF